MLENGKACSLSRLFHFQALATIIKPDYIFHKIRQIRGSDSVISLFLLIVVANVAVQHELNKGLVGAAFAKVY